MFIIAVFRILLGLTKQYITTPRARTPIKIHTIIITIFSVQLHFPLSNMQIPLHFRHSLLLQREQCLIFLQSDTAHCLSYKVKEGVHS